MSIYHIYHIASPHFINPNPEPVPCCLSLRPGVLWNLGRILSRAVVERVILDLSLSLSLRLRNLRPRLESPRPRPQNLASPKVRKPKGRMKMNILKTLKSDPFWKIGSCVLYTGVSLPHIFTSHSWWCFFWWKVRPTTQSSAVVFMEEEHCCGSHDVFWEWQLWNRFGSKLKNEWTASCWLHAFIIKKVCLNSILARSPKWNHHPGSLACTKPCMLQIVVGAPGDLGFKTSDSESEDLCDSMVDHYAKGVLWFHLVGCMINLWFVNKRFVPQPKATAKDILQQARKTEKLLKKHGLLALGFLRHRHLVS